MELRASRTEHMDETEAAGVCDGGHLDCGGGLLIAIKRAMSAIEVGHVLEIRSLEPSVGNDLPAWCRLAGHELLRVEAHGPQTRFAVRRGR